jgi:HD superfamily phosphodiesterase
MRCAGGVLDAMIGYYAGDVRRVNHFLKVYGFAKAIGEKENLSAEEQLILEVAALTHDIGIKNSELKYGSAAGTYQEIEGPPEARRLLETLGFTASVIDRVCWLIAHHHTYGVIEGLDHAILVEADFLVNAFEDDMTRAAVSSVREKVFVTGTGKQYLQLLYPVI